MKTRITETPYWHLTRREAGIWLTTVCVIFLLLVEYHNIHANPVLYWLSIFVIILGVFIIFIGCFLEKMIRKLNKLLDEIQESKKNRKR
ncbi:MAG: hypothetical protein DRR19_06795 [Candidatus Parabeggiatoa sp. nov. 1]|nr:MAG: hypothetical protein DRR19_06795 [Gammaproteobacteria bacterium]